ncbi:DNA polymerase III subunit alpha [Paeniglutamicibacter psychrophenolicus]|uniref:DNA-directed DNA polymerase n=1 Tax=Paeniglutamicibacter psychrophenolicus TaxID=257454 RepID=A0ABS4WFD3_9MICC|nr:DNA polymerase III subunit alpha [Paeniglutamicibacter psychrophenolicus]MBP2374910.1 error-prone DNA polymerase [Paeniglutamicibacter psychrophenolicus]
MSFTHLHVASAFSAHYGVSWPKDLVAAALADGADALAITDRDGLYGSVKHLKACIGHGIDPILGVDLAILEPPPHPAPHGKPPPLRTAGRIIALAKGHCNGAGYAALCHLVTTAHQPTTPTGLAKPSVGITREELATHALGPDGEALLTILLGPGSDIGLATGHRHYTQARTQLRTWRSLLGASALRVEITTHLNSPGEKLSTAHAIRMLRCATDTGIAPVLTNAVRYADPDGAATADVLDSARALSSLETLNDIQPNGQGWLKPAEHMRHLAAEIARSASNTSLAATLLRNTAALADWARLDPIPDTGWSIPVVPEAHIIGITGNPENELASRAEAGITRLIPAQANDPLMRHRLEAELSTIADLGFAPYFLTVAEVSSMITHLGIRSAARGSGASSLVNYLIGISQVNPLAHDLLFERFLSRDRATLPDIDIDVESARRHEIYRKIFERFGSDRVSLMSMQNSYRARGAVRDAGAALGMEEEDIDVIAKQLWRFSASSFREALAEKPELAPFADRLGTEKQLDLLVDLTERLDRLPRHISMHPCGVILSDAHLRDRTPVEPSGISLPMSQFDKHDMDPMGMLKLDVLGVRMQSAITYALEEIQRLNPDAQAVAKAGGHRGEAPGQIPGYIAPNGAIDLALVPLDDEPTFELIRSTHTLGCFQIESPGQRELIGKLAPREFNDLIIDISLFRPGPMKSNMVKPYLENRHGFAPEKYPHPDLAPALAETHGVTVFHEQVLRIFDVMTGCGLAKADAYRRLLGNPHAEPAVEALFRSRALGRGYSLAVIDEVWHTLAAFGSFGFCKAHGAAFAVPTYHSAWLKAHHPEAFLAGIWEHDPGMYPKRLLVAEARRMGIAILPLDINRSSPGYKVEKLEGLLPPAQLPVVPRAAGAAPPGRYGIRLSLRGIRSVSEREVARVAAGQPYDSIADVRARSGLTRTSLNHFAALGAFDSLQARTGRGNRADLIEHLRAPAGRALPQRHRPIPGQLALPLGDLDLANMAIGAAPTPLDEVVRTELDLMSIDVTAHLMESHAPLLRSLGVSHSADLLGMRNGTEVLVAGVRVATQTPPMRGGRRVVFISVDDGTGCVDATFFHEAQQRCGPLLFSTRLLLIHGLTRRTGPRGISLQALDAWDLSEKSTLPAPGHLSDPARARNESFGSSAARPVREAERSLAARMAAEDLDTRGYLGA